MDSNYSLNSKGIKQAATALINDNATYLIEYIYREAGVLPPLPKDPIDSKDDDKEDVEEVEKGCKDGKDETAEKVEKAIAKAKDPKNLPKAILSDVYPDKNLVHPDKNSIFKSTEVRVGLAIRILAKTNCYFEEDLINLILDDIDALRREPDYLLSFKDPKARKIALDEEYALVQGYVDMDDTISLNQDPETISRLSKVSKVGKLASDGQCIIQ